MANKIIILYIIIISIFFISIFLKDYARRKEKFFKQKAVDEGNILYIPLYAMTQEDKNFSSFCFELFFNSMFKIIKQIFPALIQPVLVIIHMIKGLFAAIEDQMSVIRARLMILRQFLMNVIQTVMEKISNIVAALINQQLRAVDTLKRFFAIFRTLVYVSQVSVDTLISFISGPVGDMLNFTAKLASSIVFFTLGFPGMVIFPKLFKTMYCFDKNTYIKLEKGYKYIKDIKLNDNLYNNNKVKSIFILKPKTDMYKINGNIVSNNHKILFNRNYIYVKDHPKSKKINNYNEKYIYCLNTQNNIIQTYNHTFQDYDNKIDEKYYKYILFTLNKNEYKDNIPLYPPGFISLKENESLLTLDSNNIDGIVYHYIDELNTKFYMYNNIICSGSNILLYKGNYTFLENIPGIKQIQLNNKNNYNFIHYITNNSLITINNTIFRDYNNI